MRRTMGTTLLWLLAAGAPGQAPPSEVEGLAWLEGRWQGESGGVAMEEQWTSVRGGALLGLHRAAGGEVAGRGKQDEG